MQVLGRWSPLDPISARRFYGGNRRGRRRPEIIKTVIRCAAIGALAPVIGETIDLQLCTCVYLIAGSYVQ